MDVVAVDRGPSISGASVVWERLSLRLLKRQLRSAPLASTSFPTVPYLNGRIRMREKTHEKAQRNAIQTWEIVRFAGWHLC